MNLNQKTNEFLLAYELFESDSIQQIQLQHRLDLVDTFEISDGMSVLEIGCGQGDTTVALADAVGEQGRVVGIDIASRKYGTPYTLGEATDYIKASKLGNRIEFYFETDLNSFESDDTFDVAVLSHSSWYFKHPDELQAYFKKLRKMAKYICFAEWDIDFAKMAQRPHFCAATILAMYSNFVYNEGNIQNLFHQIQIQSMLEKAGFQIVKQTRVDASYLQDGHWEVDYANSIRSEFEHTPIMIQTLAHSYYELMNVMAREQKSLDSFILCAE